MKTILRSRRLLLATLLALQVVLPSSPAFAIDQLGPGNLIAGIDISSFQHQPGKTINFNQMYAAGIRFVIIKGGDSLDQYDAQALKYLASDRSAAQAANIFTSFYYYATLPDSTVKTTVVADANAQAQKVIWRLASLGGYNALDLPVALDIENPCVRLSSPGVCSKNTTRQLATLWAQTWLDTVAQATGRKPFIYSYPTFLETYLSRTDTLRQYPLWLARYGPSATMTSLQLNSKAVGCYADSWSNADCSTQWQIWQYTSCGIPGKYGLPGTRVDLNVFNGDSTAFMNLATGLWQPDPSQELPINEPTTMTITSQSSGTTKNPVMIGVNVLRPNGTPVVAGTVNFTATPTTPSPSSSTTAQITQLPQITQSATRSSSGVWTLKLTGLSAGTYTGSVNFIDQTLTEAPSQSSIAFTVAPAPIPTSTPPPQPTPKPTPKPTVSAKPVDPCAGQVRN